MRVGNVGKGNKHMEKKCNVRWNKPLIFQEKHLFFENKEQYERFLKKYQMALRFITHASQSHPDGSVTVVI